MLHIYVFMYILQILIYYNYVITIKKITMNNYQKQMSLLMIATTRGNFHYTSFLY